MRFRGTSRPGKVNRMIRTGRLNLKSSITRFSLLTKVSSVRRRNLPWLQCGNNIGDVAKIRGSAWNLFLYFARLKVDTFLLHEALVCLGEGVVDHSVIHLAKRRPGQLDLTARRYRCGLEAFLGFLLELGQLAALLRASIKLGRGISRNDIGLSINEKMLIAWPSRTLVDIPNCRHERYNRAICKI